MTALPVSINTYSYIWSHSARECIAHLAESGYRRFELMVNPPHLWPAALARDERRAINRLLAEQGLVITSLNAPMLDLNLVSPAEEMRRYTRGHYRDIIELAGEWHVPWVVMVPGKTHPLLPAPAEKVNTWFEEAIEALVPVAERAGVRILLENIPMAFLPRAGDLMATVERLQCDRLGIIYDVANAVFAGEDPCEGLRTCWPRLELVHLSDTGLEKWDHGPVGTGVVPFEDIAATLVDGGYRNPSVLEIISLAGDEGIRRSHSALAALAWEPAP